MNCQGLSERRALRVVGMSPSAYRYQPVANRNCALKHKIIALAQRHRRYGVGMIYLKLRQAGERALGGHQLVRILDQSARTRGLPKAIRTDNGKEFCSRAIVSWAHARGVQLFLIEPGKPNQNAYPMIAVAGVIGSSTLDAYRSLEKKRGRIKASELTLKLMDSYQAARQPFTGN